MSGGGHVLPKFDESCQSRFSDVYLVLRKSWQFPISFAGVYLIFEVFQIRVVCFCFWPCSRKHAVAHMKYSSVQARMGFSRSRPLGVLVSEVLDTVKMTRNSVPNYAHQDISIQEGQHVNPELLAQEHSALCLR